MIRSGAGSGASNPMGSGSRFDAAGANTATAGHAARPASLPPTLIGALSRRADMTGVTTAS